MYAAVNIKNSKKFIAQTGKIWHGSKQSAKLSKAKCKRIVAFMLTKHCETKLKINITVNLA
jgi:ribosomal protein L30E